MATNSDQRGTKQPAGKQAPAKQAASKRASTTPTASKRAAGASAGNEQAVSEQPATAHKRVARVGAGQTSPTKRATTGSRRRTATLKGIAAIREHLSRSDVPVFFVGATPFHLLGLDRWVPTLRYVSHHDCWDGANPRVLTPAAVAPAEFASAADLTNHLLTRPEIQARLAESGKPPAIIAAAYDADTERLCTELGYHLIMPGLALRDRLESGLVAIEPADAVGQQRLVTASAVSTRRGTVVGPMSGVISDHVALAAFPGEWCGSEVVPDWLTREQRAAISDVVHTIGDQLAAEGYHGYFEADVTLDTESGVAAARDVRLRIGGAASITNLVAGAHADLPLLAIHLLEQFGIDYDVDVADLNRRWEDLAEVDSWSQLIVKAVDPTVAEIAEAPPTGRWSLDEFGQLRYESNALAPAALTDESQFFFLRVYGPGELSWPGADLGIVLAKGRLQADAQCPTHRTLTPRAHMIISGLRQQYLSVGSYELAAAGLALS